MRSARALLKSPKNEQCDWVAGTPKTREKAARQEPAPLGGSTQACRAKTQSRGCATQQNRQPSQHPHLLAVHAGVYVQRKFMTEHVNLCGRRSKPLGSKQRLRESVLTAVSLWTNSQLSKVRTRYRSGLAMAATSAPFGSRPAPAATVAMAHPTLLSRSAEPVHNPLQVRRLVSTWQSRAIHSGPSLSRTAVENEESVTAVNCLNVWC
ncbi:hypothetical protein TGDOM2_271375 [Toxoplasma gondii GAB2-2007-GAL-DOM2]|uniref:Uncharacterized protein n=6 Tax=Toxoplasma gondii TaxID=5811 RepID=S7V4T1_TOXGG|nr:hypothetical protein TGGT1_271375 [Toxoplasma gondii GT1]KAF4642190.1 hypothetical protein TGRH88_080030 [Toxoplasma gondii]KFG43460.1 hypothetical protein TGDOM2_271375 [Toxoplasma gondii GAB2-2007-GAL-DOM2]KFG54275.1 hypothetical protein TGFOU_271375 [Toxoplasma gondii FOU]PUA92198.1 hypothetical protein TGBR9_271375 [Toxoplasma gondii TgCATBr9]RQX75366.1 hypothetical protein TGCAST_271375 [Toxoplasma gondii CAST]